MIHVSVLDVHHLGGHVAVMVRLEVQRLLDLFVTLIVEPAHVQNVTVSLLVAQGASQGFVEGLKADIVPQGRDATENDPRLAVFGSIIDPVVVLLFIE